MWWHPSLKSPVTNQQYLSNRHSQQKQSFQYIRYIPVLIILKLSALIYIIKGTRWRRPQLTSKLLIIKKHLKTHFRKVWSQGLCSQLQVAASIQQPLSLKGETGLWAVSCQHFPWLNSSEGWSGQQHQVRGCLLGSLLLLTWSPTQKADCCEHVYV